MIPLEDRRDHTAESFAETRTGKETLNPAANDHVKPTTTMAVERTRRPNSFSFSFFEAEERMQIEERARTGRQTIACAACDAASSLRPPWLQNLSIRAPRFDHTPRQL
jgi:hypothetical protein